MVRNREAALHVVLVRFTEAQARSGRRLPTDLALALMGLSTVEIAQVRAARR